MSGYDEFSRFYDSLTDNVDYKKRAGYFSTLLIRYGAKSGACVLDIGCGTGRMCVEMAKLGYEMIGADPSPEMLCEARSNAAQSGADILFLCQSAEELDLFGTVDAAISTLDVINHLDGKGSVQKAFYNAGLFMNPGGIFIFDINTVYKHRHVLGSNTFVYETDDVYCVWQNTLNADDSVDISLDFFEYDADGGCYIRSGEDFCEYAYDIGEIVSMLEKADFELLGVFDDMSFEEINDKSQRAVIAAKYTGKRDIDG